MKLNLFPFLTLCLLLHNSPLYGKQKCIPLTKSDLHALLTSPSKAIKLGDYGLHLKNTCETTCGEDCDVILHGGYQELDKIDPYSTTPDRDGTCVYNLGPNDHIHVEIIKMN